MPAPAIVPAVTLTGAMTVVFKSSVPPPFSINCVAVTLPLPVKLYVPPGIEHDDRGGCDAGWTASNIHRAAATDGQAGVVEGGVLLLALAARIHANRKSSENRWSRHPSCWLPDAGCQYSGGPAHGVSEIGEIWERCCCHIGERSPSYRHSRKGSARWPSSGWQREYEVGQ